MEECTKTSLEILTVWVCVLDNYVQYSENCQYELIVVRDARKSANQPQAASQPAVGVLACSDLWVLFL